MSAPTVDDLAAQAANIRANMRGQARPGRHVFLFAEEANKLLDYIDALERELEQAQYQIGDCSPR